MHSPHEHIEPIGKIDLWVSGQNVKKSLKNLSNVVQNKAHIFPLPF